MKKQLYRNYMDEMLDIISEIDCLKPEPEACNVRCPPLGCPRGPCPGMCCYDGICNPFCMSQMPNFVPPVQPPRCCAPPGLAELARLVGRGPPPYCSPAYSTKTGCPRPCYPNNCSPAVSWPGCSPSCNSPGPFCSTCITPSCYPGCPTPWSC
ncbi:keratin-associated protein 9-8-like [Prorops nasuta]|uniref:keratin-associated protein 9-8-like n=1 Tax=Prorops nasuta TaxID=863751 RepID=UPI0034CF0CEC